MAATSSGSYFLYAADSQANNIKAYTIDGNTGALSPIPRLAIRSGDRADAADSRKGPLAPLPYERPSLFWPFPVNCRNIATLRSEGF